MNAAIGAWFANPVTALVAALVLLSLLAFAFSGLIAIVRLGRIRLAGLVGQRGGFTASSVDVYVSLILLLQAVVGLLLVLLALAWTRFGVLAAAGWPLTLIGVILAWLGALTVGLAIARGPRLEVTASAALFALRPLAPLVHRFAVLEGTEEAVEEREEEAADEHEVQAFIGAGEQAGILAREDAELVASIVELSDTVAREIMTPRTDIVALPLDADFAAVERTFAESMFTRIPVYRETLDRIEGVVHVKDVLRALASDTRPSAGELIRSLLVVPETKPVRELLREFQNAHQQLAAVVDEYGGISGIVTLEDVLEEIVGEIQDEHQRQVPDVEKESDGTYLVNGAAHVEVLEELFGVEVGEVGFDSVAGLVLETLGHLPRIGERASWQGLDLEVVGLERRRVRRVRVRRAT